MEHWSVYILLVPASFSNFTPVLLCYSGCSPLSESANAVGAGFAVPAVQSGYLPMAEVFKLAVSSFKVNDWNLFGNGARDV